TRGRGGAGRAGRTRLPRRAASSRRAPVPAGGLPGAWPWVGVRSPYCREPPGKFPPVLLLRVGLLRGLGRVEGGMGEAGGVHRPDAGVGIHGQLHAARVGDLRDDADVGEPGRVAEGELAATLAEALLDRLEPQADPVRVPVVALRLVEP